MRRRVVGKKRQKVQLSGKVVFGTSPTPPVSRQEELLCELSWAQGIVTDRQPGPRWTRAAGLRATCVCQLVAGAAPSLRHGPAPWGCFLVQAVASQGDASKRGYVR